MEILQELKSKGRLCSRDASSVLQLIQQLTAPILSLRGCASSPLIPVTPSTLSASPLADQPCSPGSGSKEKSRDESRDHLNLYSLEEFPSLTVQSRTDRPPSSKTKRRITPTLVRPQLTNKTVSFSLHGVDSTASISNTFIKSSLHSTTDLAQALKEDREDIRKEITLRRSKQVHTKEKTTYEGFYNGLETNGRTESFSLKKHNKVKNIPTVDCHQERSSTIKSSSSVVYYTKELIISGLTNQEVLGDLCIVYAKVIKGFLVPSVVSELYFLLQLLTLNVSCVLTEIQGKMGTTVFRTVKDCVYFAVMVLDNIKELFLLLDRSSLHLLAHNHWISVLKPQLKQFFDKHLHNTSSDQAPVISNEELVGGLFQETTDNSRNFPDMKSFHAFKNQRDLFYTLLREWESSHEDPKWCMRDALGERIQTIVRHYGEVCCCSYFAKLFLRQLVESFHSSIRRASGTDWIENDIDQLKMDPGRLIKLAKRFYAPMSCGGLSSSPSFTNIEEFYADFIRIADSYTFNFHLKLTLSDEIRQIQEKVQSTVKDANKYFSVVLSLRVMAKFLGFLDFLPFSKASCAAATASRPTSLELVQCLDEAGSRGHLCMAVPWVVEYLSMMDGQAASQHQCRSVLLLLIAIYKSFDWYDFSSSNIGYVLISTLGWLFEIPNFPSGLFSDSGIKLPKSLAFGHLPGSLDNTLSISTDWLYLCCPFMNNFRVLLAEYNSGLQTKANPRRKIKPLSTAIVMVENPMNDVQQQVVDMFFRNHPPHLKQLCEVTTERLFGLVIHELEQYIFPKYVAMAYSEGLKWLQTKISEWNDDKGVKLPSELEADDVLAAIVIDINGKLENEVPGFVIRYCVDQGKRILSSLFASSLGDEVFSTACKITSFWSIQRCLKWTHVNKMAVQEKVSAAFGKTRHKFLVSSQSCANQETGSGVSLSYPGRSEFCNFKSDSLYSSYTQVMSILSSFKNKFVSEFHHTLCSQEIISALSAVNTTIKQTCFITPGLPSQVVTSYWQDFIHSLMDITVHLVSCGYFTHCDVSNSGQMCDGILEHLRATWRLCKDLKLEVSMDKLMGVEAFNEYFERLSSNQDLAEQMWLSLANALIVGVLDNVTSSPVIEGLWLCRLRQKDILDTAQFQRLLDAVFTFLKLWNNVSGSSTNFFKEVHFFRLSCYIKAKIQHVTV